MSDIGILGGTFDPFHNGHLSIADTAVKDAGLKKVILMPARVSPFKIGREMASDVDRLNMVKLGANGHKGLEVSTIELNSDGVSYTYKTLSILKKYHPDDILWFIMGTDQFICLESWYKGPDLLREFSFILAVRPGFDDRVTRDKIARYTELYGTSVRILHNRQLDISSTDIKKAVREGRDISDLVPPDVERYIYEHRLYREIH
ncbi:MAG: nicotinate-nucleotide adenylyltransferase [Eubacteriales bacterium]|nr:nicotinate-nucleotide adenylyltransferase [Eubacteriales bacterium]